MGTEMPEELNTAKEAFVLGTGSIVITEDGADTGPLEGELVYDNEQEHVTFTLRDDAFEPTKNYLAILMDDSGYVWSSTFKGHERRKAQSHLLYNGIDLEAQCFLSKLYIIAQVQSLFSVEDAVLFLRDEGEVKELSDRGIAFFVPGGSIRIVAPKMCQRALRFLILDSLTKEEAAVLLNKAIELGNYINPEDLQEALLEMGWPELQEIFAESPSNKKKIKLENE
jgi:hypothetical protein